MFKMIRNIVQCDVCPNTFPLHPQEEIIPPASWHIVYHGAHQFIDAKHFCSEDCLLAHYGAIRAVTVGARQIAREKK